MQAYYINMDHRKDRRQRMERELRRVGLHATRVRGRRPDEWPAATRHRVAAMQARTPGSIGGHLTHIQTLGEAHYASPQDVMIFEDDAVFCSDFPDRLRYIRDWQATHEWDIVWLGGTFHVGPPFWHPHGPSGMTPDCSAHLGRDAEVTDDPRMMRTYGAFCIYAYMINHASIPRVLKLLDEQLEGSIGLDWLFIKIAPQLRTFAFVPGCVKQTSDPSDVSGGTRDFEQFASLGPYWWQDRMTDFDPTTFDWKEAQR